MKKQYLLGLLAFLTGLAWSGVIYTAAQPDIYALNNLPPLPVVAHHGKVLGLVQAFTSADPIITTSILPIATVGQTYSVQLQASGGIAPYSWSIDISNIPCCSTSLSSGGVFGTTYTPGTTAATITGPAGNYSITFQATDANGTTATRTLSLQIVDITPPSVPTNLSATVVSSSQINLSWTVSNDNVAVTGYKVYRGGVQIGTSATNSYFNTGLTTSTSYTYTVSAYDAAGNTSAQSSVTSATTQAANPSAMSITTPSLPSATVGQSYSASVHFSATNVSSAFVTISGLPAGLSLSGGYISSDGVNNFYNLSSLNLSSGGADIVISGIPTQAGTYPISIGATGNTGVAASANYTLIVNPATTSSSVTASFTATDIISNVSSDSNGNLIVPFGHSVVYKWSSSNANASGFGISVDSADSCNTPVVNPSSISIGFHGDLSGIWAGWAPPNPLSGGNFLNGVSAPIIYNTACLQPGRTYAIAFQAFISGTGQGTAKVIHVFLQSALPTATFTVKDNGVTQLNSFTAVVGDTLTYNWSAFNATNGAITISANSPDTCIPAVMTSPTPWVSFPGTGTQTSGSVSLVANACQAEHTYTLTYTAYNALKGSPSIPSTPQSLVITVTDKATMLMNTTLSIPNGTVGQPYSATFTYSYSGPWALNAHVTGLPPGLSGNGLPSDPNNVFGLLPGLSGSTLVILGTPTQAGTYNVQVTFEDQHGSSISKTYSVIISPINTTTPSIKVLSPNGGEVWHPGEVHRVTWNSSGVRQVKIYIYDNSISSSGSTNYIVPNNASVPASQGYYDWTVPALSGSNYRIRVDGFPLDSASYNDPGVIMDSSDAPFSIVAANTSGTLDISYNSSTPPAFASYLANSTNVNFGTYDFKNTYTDGTVLNITQLNLSIGPTKNTIKNVRVFLGANQISPNVQFDANGKVQVNLNSTLVVYSTAQITIKADLDTGAVTGINVCVDKTPFSTVTSSGSVTGSYQALSICGNPITVSTQVTGPTHTSGTNVLAGNLVYFISPDGTKRPYTSAGAFLSYGFNFWSDVVSATSGDLALPTGTFVPPQDGSLINDKGTIYLITNGQRIGFANSYAFLGLGYSFRNAIPADTSFMTAQNPITSPNVEHPDGSLINDNGTIYLMQMRSEFYRIGIPSENVFASWGYNYRNVVSANGYDDAKPVWGILNSHQPGELSPRTSSVTPISTGGSGSGGR